MAKSLEELELAFQAQYPKVEKKRRFKKQSPVDRQAEAIQKETTQAVRSEDIAQRMVGEAASNHKKDEPEAKLEAELEAELEAKPEAKSETKLEVASTTSQRRAKEDKVTTFSIRDFVFYGILLLMVVGAIIFSREVLGNQSLGGKSFYEVTTTSMQSVYPKGSLVFAKNIDPKVLMVGDDIAFINEEGDIIISRIVEIKEDEGNNQVFVTSGVSEPDGSNVEVLANEVIGKVTSGIPVAGAILNWIGTNLLLVFALLGALIVILVGVKLSKHKDKNPPSYSKMKSVK